MSTESQISSSGTNHTDTQLQHKDVQSQMNVTFVEEQPIVSDDARLGHSLAALPPTMSRQMPDADWYAAQQLSKPIVIRQFTWSADNTPGQILQSFNFPAVLAENDTLVKETLNMYSFFKFNWTVKLQINGTRFHSGQLICSWDPFGLFYDEADAQYRGYNVVVGTGLPHVLLNANTNEPVQISVPFVSPRNYLTTNSQAADRLGRFRISVLNPLRLATGSSSQLTITVWFFATDPSVHVPIYRHEYKPINEYAAVQSMDAFKGLASSFGNSIAGNMPGFSSVVPKLASMLGLDYPTRPVIEQSHINPIGPMSVGKGVDSSYRLSLDPRSGHVPGPDQTGTTKDECDMDYIKTIPMLFRQILWSDSSAPGTVLTYYPVTPNIVAGVPTSVAYNTFLSWFSNAFTFWKGGLEYRYEFVSTQFHTGRLLIAFIPNYFSGTPTLAQAYSCPNVVLDLQETSSAKLTVPFISPTIWKQCAVGYDGTVSQNDENVVGYVYVYVLNPLVRPSNVADTIEFNIYISGASDFEFAVPRADQLVVYVPKTADEIDAVQSMDVDRMDTRTAASNSPTSVSMAFGTPLIPSLNFFGETFPLCDLMKRYGLIRTVKMTDQFDVISIDNRPQVNNDADTQISSTFYALPLTPLTIVTSVFACWFGSLRYKFATDAPRTTTEYLTATYATAKEFSDQTGAHGGNGYPIQRTNLAQNSALDVEVPCYTLYNFLLATPTVNSEIGSPTSAGIVRAYVGNSSNSRVVDIYQAAGDDFRPFYLIPPPSDYVRVIPPEKPSTPPTVILNHVLASLR